MLTREQVVSVYQQVLEREPSEEEIERHLAATSSLEQILRAALDSDEYAALLAQRAAAEAPPPVVNIHHPDLAAWTLQPGTRSDDDVAIVGREGWLFLCGGTNANLGQYVGAVQMERSWLKDWKKTLRKRAKEVRALGLPTALLVVPDKLPVYEEHYPEPLDRVGPRPIERLLGEAELGIVYPLAELRAAAAAGEEVFLRTDTHLSFRGNQVLFESVRAALGVESAPSFADLHMHAYPSAGDLGSKFEPPILAIMREPGTLHGAEVVEDNRAEIAAVGGHIGTRRVFRNEGAPDRRVAVVFGDSFGFGAANYQGISWFLAQVFREVHFVWVPFGWDADYVREVGAGAVLVQGAERFVARVPRVSTVVAELAAETLRRKEPVGIEQVLD